VPTDKIRAFAATVETLVVVEEVEPLVELELKAAGIQCLGKEILPRQGELAPNVLKPAIARLLGEPVPELPFAPSQVFPRPPTMCVACPHLGVYYTLAQIKNITIAGDIGCYTLGAGHPWNALDTTISMGASMGIALGLDKGRSDADKDKRILAVIGDSTFLHMGMQGLLDIVYNGGNVTVLLLDNRAVGMTGGQPNPGSGRDINGDEAPRVDFARLVEALGVKNPRPRPLPVAGTVQDHPRRDQDSGSLGHHHRPALRTDRRLQQAEALRSHRRQVHRLRQLRRRRLPGDPCHAPREGGQAFRQGRRTAVRPHRDLGLHRLHPVCPALCAECDRPCRPRAQARAACASLRRPP
jgi:hypothetical protein